MPELSIVIPVYNAAPWLSRCLDSVRGQTFSDWEALVVDDGSTDGSADICREYASRDSRFHFWTQPHGGVVSARRAAVRQARGGWVGFVDADDWTEPEMYQEMMAAAAGAEAVVCGYIRHASGTAAVPPVFPGEGLWEGGEYEEKVLDGMLCAWDRSAFDRMAVLWNKLLPTPLVRRALEETDGRMRRGEDALCVYTCLLRARRLVCLERPLYHYRIHAGSLMQRVGFEEYEDTSLFYHQLLRAVQRLRPSLAPQADSLFLYLISLGVGKNPALAGYPEVREALRREALRPSCPEWRQRVMRLRLKSLTAPRARPGDGAGRERA